MRMIFVALLSLGVTAFADEPTPPPKPKTDPAKVAQWVKQLDHDEFAVREAATEALGKADVSALPAIKTALEKGSPEVRSRATQVLVAWYLADDKDGIDAVEDAIEKLLDSAGTVGDQAEVVWGRHSQARELRCLAHLERLGARVRYREQRGVGLIDRDDLVGERKILESIAITAKWTGGEDGLKYIRRMTPKDTLSFVVYRVNGNTVSDDAFQALEDNGVKVEKRGAKLGVGNSPGFDPAADLKGFHIGRIDPGTAAEKGGLLIDDIIIGFGDKPVDNFNDLVGLLLQTKPGDKAEFTILREKQGVRVPMKLTVELGDW